MHDNPGLHLLQLRSEEHTSELQSPCNIVCRLLLEKKKNKRQMCSRRHGKPQREAGHIIRTSLLRRLTCQTSSSRASSRLSLSLVSYFFFFLMIGRPPRSPLFPSTTLFQSIEVTERPSHPHCRRLGGDVVPG